MGVAAGCGVVGLCAAMGWPPWPAATFLVDALLVALVTLCFAIGNHHRAPASIAARVILLSLLLAVDATIVVSLAAGATVGLRSVLAVELAASVLLHVRALARVLGARDVAAASGPAVAALATAVGARGREAIGIVRARAESLRLAAEEAGVTAQLGHDLEVLVRQAEECQRALREIDDALEARSARSARLPARPWPSESTPLRS
jgi:hypothetical protein